MLLGLRGRRREPARPGMVGGLVSGGSGDRRPLSLPDRVGGAFPVVHGNSVSPRPTAGTAALFTLGTPSKWSTKDKGAPSSDRRTTSPSRRPRNPVLGHNHFGHRDKTPTPRRLLARRHRAHRDGPQPLDKISGSLSGSSAGLIKRPVPETPQHKLATVSVGPLALDDDDHYCRNRSIWQERLGPRESIHRP